MLKRRKPRSTKDTELSSNKLQRHNARFKETRVPDDQHGTWAIGPPFGINPPFIRETFVLCIKHNAHAMEVGLVAWASSHSQ